MLRQGSIAAVFLAFVSKESIGGACDRVGVTDGEILRGKLGESAGNEGFGGAPGNESVAAGINGESGPDIISGSDGVVRTGELIETGGLSALTFDRGTGEDSIDIAGDRLDTEGINSETADSGDVETGAFNTSGEGAAENRINIQFDGVEAGNVSGDSAAVDVEGAHGGEFSLTVDRGGNQTVAVDDNAGSSGAGGIGQADRADGADRAFNILYSAVGDVDGGAGAGGGIVTADDVAGNGAVSDAYGSITNSCAAVAAAVDSTLLR